MSVRWGTNISTKIAFLVIFFVTVFTIFITTWKAISVINEIEEGVMQIQIREEQTLEMLKR